MKLKHSLIAGAALLALASCNNNAKDHTDTAGVPKLLDPKNIDTTVLPSENFYRFANGTWLKNNPIPSDQTRWGSFSELQENNYKALLTLLQDAAKANASAGSKEQKVGDLYQSGMDTNAIEKAGITPLNEHFARINAITDANGILNEVALEHTLGINALFNFGISPDDKEVTKQIAQFAQGGLGMPDRDYYFKTDKRTTDIRTAYRQYLVKVFTLIGDDTTTAAKDAASVLKLETTLAGASMDRVAMRNPYKLYNKFNIAGINQRTPGLDWQKMLATLKVTGQDSILVATPDFFGEVAKQMKATPLPVWKKYLQVQLAMDVSPFLSKAFVDANFDFFGRTVRGQKTQKPRWKSVMGVVDGSVGELLGQMYVDKNFKHEAKKRMLDLVNNLEETYAARIKRLSWMSDVTKEKALTKLHAFVKKIGYPDKWKDYSALNISKEGYLKNIMNANLFEYNYELSKLGKPVDRTIWGMTPPTVNAYYNPSFNEIVFPAGILQWPFFSDKADDAVNYGGIGAVIGHEMTHGFDDQGRLYDADGNLKNWWTPADSAAFTQRANVVVKQFDNYTVLDTIHVKGLLTIGENLADLGGINIAYEAFHKTKQGQGTEKIDGFTPDQRFFLSWAQVWRANTRDEELQARIVTDPHSPGELRCNGPVSNMPEFYKAFNVKPGDKMYRPDSIRASVW